jgi:hypothetical protein
VCRIARVPVRLSLGNKRASKTTAPPPALLITPATSTLKTPRACLRTTIPPPPHSHVRTHTHTHARFTQHASLGCNGRRSARYAVLSAIYHLSPPPAHFLPHACEEDARNATQALLLFHTCRSRSPNLRFTSSLNTHCHRTALRTCTNLLPLLLHKH